MKGKLYSKPLFQIYKVLTRARVSDTGRMKELSKILDEIHEKYVDENLRVRLLPKASTTSKDDDELLKHCSAYIEVFAKEQCCFDDISPYVERLDDARQAKFLEWCSYLTKNQDGLVQEGSPKQQAQALRTKANVLKLEYQLTISKDEKASKDQLEDFVVKALDIHQTATGKDVATCEDACALAIMALVRLFYLESSQGYLVQAEVVMKELLVHSPESRKAGLLHARLASFLGNFSEAMNAWSGIKIKEILMETLAHHMFTRMAITHPFYYRSKQNTRANQDPLTQLEKVLQTADKILHTIQAFLGAEIDALQYDRLLEIQELKTNLSNSLSRKISVIERRRTLRIRGESVDEMFCEVLDDDFDSILDNRDLTRMWNYEHSATRRFEHSISSGPTPGKYWLALFLLIDDTCTVISSPDSRRTTAANIEKLANNPSEQDLVQLTPAERAIIPGWVQLRALTSKALATTPTNDALATIAPDVAGLATWLSALAKPDSDSLEEALLALSVSSSNSNKPLLPLQHDVQTLYLVAELLQACVRLCDAAARLHKTKPHKWCAQIPVKELAGLRAAAQDAFAKAVRQPALDWTNRLSSDEGGVGSVVEAAKAGRTGEELVKVLGEGRFADVAGLLVQGATDGLDGVLKVKLA